MSLTRTVVRLLLAGLFVGSGVLHFVRPGPYVRIVPPALPHPDALVLWSGVAEVLGGVGLLVPRARRPAAIGLVALLLAVWPANVQMYADARAAGASSAWQALLLARLPLQLVLMAGVWWAGRAPGGREPRSSPARS
jgi:uncharacterized membrane protein